MDASLCVQCRRWRVYGQCSQRMFGSVAANDSSVVGSCAVRFHRRRQRSFAWRLELTRGEGVLSEATNRRQLANGLGKRRMSRDRRARIVTLRGGRKEAFGLRREQKRTGFQWDFGRDQQMRRRCMYAWMQGRTIRAPFHVLLMRYWYWHFS